MSINLDNFIFHSDYLSDYKTDNDDTVELSVTGNINAGASSLYCSDWVTIPEGATRINGRVYIPGVIYFTPSISANNCMMSIPSLSIIYNISTYLSFNAFVQVQNNRYRCCILVINPYNYTIESPNRTFTFTLSKYFVQNS